jgi:putative ABC transport system substrate-binding protein
MKYSRLVQMLASIMVLVVLAFQTAACAPRQQTLKVGIINTDASLEPILQGFKDGLAGYGYVEGQNIEYIYQGAAKADTIELHIDAMIKEKVDLVLALSTPAALEAKKFLADTGIPAIYAPISDPIVVGLANSISEPGNHMTGIKSGGYVEKELSWLIHIAPRTRLVFAPYNPSDSSSSIDSRQLGIAAQKFGVKIVSAEIYSAADVSKAIQNMDENVDAILLLSDPSILSGIQEFAAFAMEKKIPLISVSQSQAEAGALLSYGPEFYDMGKQCARLADQIFKDIDPGSLPIEVPEFYLTLNMQTAKNLGVEFPEAMLKAARTIIR